jgi:L-arabinose transport system substrate-binding protein
MKKLKGVLILTGIIAMVLSFAILPACDKGIPPAAEPAKEEVESTEEEATAEEEEATAEEGFVVGLINKDLENIWFNQVAVAAEKSINEAGGSLIAVDAKMDPKIFMDALDNLISQGVDGLILTVPDQGLSEAIIDKVTDDEGNFIIPTIAQSDPLIDENGVWLAPGFILEGYLTGSRIGEAFANYVLENDLIQDPLTSAFAGITCTPVSQFVPRTDGALDAWKEIITEDILPSTQYFTSDTVTSYPDEAYEATNALLTQYPEITTWFFTGPNDDTIVGVARATEAAGIQENCYLAGLGAYYSKDEWKKDFSNIVLDLYISGTEDGAQVGKDMANWILTGVIPYMEYRGAHDPVDVNFGSFPYTGVIVYPDDYEEIMGEDAL